MGRRRQKDCGEIVSGNAPSPEMVLLWLLLILAFLKLAVLIFIVARQVQVLNDLQRILQGIATQLAVQDARQQAYPNE